MARCIEPRIWGATAWFDSPPELGSSTAGRVRNPFSSTPLREVLCVLAAAARELAQRISPTAI